MLVAVLCLLVLGGAWLRLKRQAAAQLELPGAWDVAQTWRGVALGALLVVGSCLPVLALAPWTSGAGSFLPGDAASHAKVAAEIARFGVPHGWLESYLGGFPIGHHYPPLGWLLLSLGIRLGLEPALAVNTLGFVATFAAPLILYASAVRAGARPLFAGCGAALLALVSPYNGFVGGFEVYFAQGLVSQALALPLCIAFAAAMVCGSRWEATLFGSLSMLAHPQLAGASAMVVAVVAMVDGARGRRVSIACGLGAAILTALSVYGQGLATLRVPFGWPPMLGWRVVGFGTSRLVWWFRDGDLLDRGATTPVLTALTGAAALSCVLLIKRRAARAALLLAFTALLASSSGPWLVALPGLGALLLEFVQPLRVLALLPAIFGLLLVVALEEGTAALGSVRLPRRLGRRPVSAAWLATAIPLTLLALTLPVRARAAQQAAAYRSGGVAATCSRIPGYDARLVSGWLSGLQGGSLWFDDVATDLAWCLSSQGVELRSSVPLGTTGAVGGHVGSLLAAAKQLQPRRAGLAQRAEALGIRYLLQEARADGALAAGFERHRSNAGLELLELPGARRAHLGCVRERWTGGNRVLRDHLARQLAQPASADRVLDPQRLIELEPGVGELKISPVAEPCDAGGATLRLLPREPGIFEAFVVSEAPVDVVFHASAFPAWRVAIDGAPGQPVRISAPGYFFVRVGPGRHRVVATAGTMPGYAWLLALAALAIAALAWLEPRHLGLKLAAQRGQPQAPDDHDRLDKNSPVHLRASDAPIDESDR